MTKTSTETGSADNLARDRAARLFTYLKELTELRGSVKRSCDEYDQVLWWAEIPREKECYCAAWNLGSEGAYEEWIRVERPRRKKPPSPPPTLAPWLNGRDVADSSLDAPPLKETILEEIAGGACDGKGEPETIVRKLTDWPAVSRQWELFVENHWWPWAQEDCRLQSVQSIYNQLFAAYQTQERLGEAFEAVVGIGLLAWRPPHGSDVRRHVVVAQVTIEFDSKTGMITVASAPDGARLSLEQDMLEPQDRPLPDIQNRIQQQLTEAGEEIWSGPELTTALNAYFQQLSLENSLDLALGPQDAIADLSRPRMNLAPALIVRPRTERNLVRIFSEIAEQLKEGGTVPVGVERLVQIRDDRVPDEEAEQDGAATAEGELYFPLPANDAQRQVAQRLATRQGVLVQGPPGTGKSHTITNLICHLLATGKRLLVTSQTARALRALKKFFPEDISPLCVSLLGDDTAALRELEESVQGILNQLNQWDTGRNQSRICHLKSDLDRSRRELAEAYTDLKRVRASEAQSSDLGFGGYRGTPQALAQRLVAEAPQFNWLTLEVPPDREPPLKNAEARELLGLVRALGEAPGDDTLRTLPELSSLLQPTAFDQLVLRERELAARLESTSSEAKAVLQPLAAASAETRMSLGAALRAFLTALDSFALETEPWVKQAVQDTALGRHHGWQRLFEATTYKIGAIAERVARVAQVRVSGLEGRDHAVVRADAEILQSHLATGKGTGLFVRCNPFTPKRLKASMYLVDGVRVEGRPCDCTEVVAGLLDYLDVVDTAQYIDQLWSPYLQPLSLPLQLAFSEQTRRAELLRRVLALRSRIENIATVANRIPELPSIDFHERQAVSNLLALLSAAALQENLQEVQRQIGGLAAHLGSLRRNPNAHYLISELMTAVETRDLDRYSRTHDQIVATWDVRSRCERRRVLERQLSKLDLLSQLLASPFDGAWDHRLEGFESAWSWARANAWLKQQTDPHRERALLQKIDLSQQRIRQDLHELAACKAWEFVLVRLKPEQREHLMAWRLAVKKIGKGTGKYAAQHRKEARYHLDHCRGAIPAWVMPIYRVAETTRPAPSLFDVAIIDEASQSGPEALFLLYIAKKIVVVGDDQQISPESVGLDRGAVDSLRERYIGDLPHCDALGVDNSFFDQAQIRFAARIRLREHFRCMPEIIQFSNNLCYQAEPLVPLRQYGTERLAPVLTRHVSDGYANGTGDRVVNRPEAEAIVEQITKCLADPAYAGKSFGVICLQGNAQASLIRDLLMDRIGVQKMQERALVCGNAYAFQGDERDVIFLSMVAATNDGRHIGVLSKESDKRRFNVAASRARDQMWLFHSVTLEDLSSYCLRRQLLEYCLDPKVDTPPVGGVDVLQLRRQAYEVNRADTRPPQPFESWFEVDVFLQIVDRGFRVIPQYHLAGKWIDLLIEGMKGRLAVECDGDQWHGLEEWERDVERQRMLVRCGLQFWRVRGSAFYRDPQRALEPLWQTLRDRGIYSGTASAPAGEQRTEPSFPPTPATSDTGDDEDFADSGSAVAATDAEAEAEETDARQASLFSSLSESEAELPIALAKYTQWSAHPVADPHSASLPELIEGLIEIVAAEGPMVCRRAYSLYNRAAGNSRLGKQIVHVMNRAIYRAVRLGRLQQNDEQRRGGQLNQIVRIAGTPDVVVRERGPRSLDEIPPLEIRVVRDALLGDDPALEEDQLVRRLAAIYGVGRVTTQIRKSLLG